MFAGDSKLTGHDVLPGFDILTGSQCRQRAAVGRRLDFHRAGIVFIEGPLRDVEVMGAHVGQRAAGVAGHQQAQALLEGGADPLYVGRRMIRMASEDIGLADPRALRLALDAAEVYERLGSPEGELTLAQCVIYLAMAPKSNAAYKAYNEARAFVKRDGTRPVPMHLRNAPTKLMKDLDYGKGYRYAHDEEGGFAAGENYLPEGMAEPGFYRPVSRGLEIKISEKLTELKRLNREQGKP